VSVLNWVTVLAASLATKACVPLTAIAVAGHDAFVVNPGDSTITEFNTVTGALVRVWDDSSYAFNLPFGIAIHGADAFVTNQDGNSVTEFNLNTGALVRILNTSNYGFDGPTDIVLSGPDAFVANEQGNSITEFKIANGAIVQLPVRVEKEIRVPSSLAISGNDAFVDDVNAKTVTEFDTVTGALVRVVNTKSFGSQSFNVATAGDIALLTELNYTHNGDIAPAALVEFSVKTGKLVRSLHTARYGFNGPSAIAISGQNVFVTNVFASTVTEFNATTGALVRILR
jgi:outer membrane protein assembly factor BamB